jgi:hypothetical protein
LEETRLVKVQKTAIMDGSQRNSLNLYTFLKSLKRIESFGAGPNKPYMQTHIPLSARAVLDGVEYSKISKAHRKKRDKDKDDEVHDIDVLAMMESGRQEDRQTLWLAERSVGCLLYIRNFYSTCISSGRKSWNHKYRCISIAL